jgi:FkbM family methyltransferase
LLNYVRKCFLWAPAEALVLRVVRGAPMESRLAKILPNHYQYPKPSFRRVRRFGLEYSLDISNLVDWAIFYELREAEQEIYYRRVRKGGTVLDVGANVGSTLLRFAQAVGESGRVFGFEPDPVNFSRCQRNLKLNLLTNITLENFALGSEPSVAKLYRVDDRNPGMNRILPSDPGVAFSEVRVAVLDDYIKENKIDKVDAIKIDVEGFELNVLKGARKTIEQFKPILFMELSDENLRQNGSSALELISYLNCNGAKITRAANGLKLDCQESLNGIKAEIICEFPN